MYLTIYVSILRQENVQLSHTGLFTFSMVVSPLPSTAVYIHGRRGRHTNGNGVLCCKIDHMAMEISTKT